MKKHDVVFCAVERNKAGDLGGGDLTERDIKCQMNIEH